MVSFHAEEADAFDHQDDMPDVPPPEKLTARELPKQPIFTDRSEIIRPITGPMSVELRPLEIGRYFGQKYTNGRCAGARPSCRGHIHAQEPPHFGRRPVVPW